MGQQLPRVHDNTWGAQPQLPHACRGSPNSKGLLVVPGNRCLVRGIWGWGQELVGLPQTLHHLPSRNIQSLVPVHLWFQEYDWVRPHRGRESVNRKTIIESFLCTQLLNMNHLQYAKE